MSQSRRITCLALGAVAALVAACAQTPVGAPVTSGSSQVDVAPGTGSGSEPTSTCVTNPAAVAAAAQPVTATGPMPADLVTVLDGAAAASFAAAAAPGAVVAVQTPAGTWTKAYGMADPAAGVAMTTDVHTRIGSVTKTFIGSVLLQLATEHALSLDDTIGRYEPGVPHGDEVTLRQLADMTSGVASYTLDEAWVRSYLADPARVWTPDELVAIGIALPAEFAPGTEFSYSNTNTVLLGKVIEQVTGQPIGRVLADRVLGPLGLRETTFPDGSPVLPDPHPRGYTLQSPAATPDRPVDATDWNPSWGWTAGEMTSTAADLLVYGRALGTGQGLLPAATQVERLTSFPGKAGYGIAMGCVNGWVGHSGELPGFNTSVFYDTSHATTVVVETNSDIASGGCTQTATLTDNPSGLPCSDPATRIFVGLSEALGRPFTPLPKK